MSEYLPYFVIPIVVGLAQYYFQNLPSTMAPDEENRILNQNYPSNYKIAYWLGAILIIILGACLGGLGVYIAFFIGEKIGGVDVANTDIEFILFMPILILSIISTILFPTASLCYLGWKFSNNKFRDYLMFQQMKQKWGRLNYLEFCKQLMKLAAMSVFLLFGLILLFFIVATK